jgi:hypothetical protein
MTSRYQLEVSDEILEHIAEVIGEMTGQIDCQHQDQMVEIDSDTPETVPLTARIEERYTAMHLAYYAQTIPD